MKKFLLILMLSLTSLCLNACNTTKGFGQDVENLGEAIEEAADDESKD
jgi:predicted small secreted protein